MKRLIKSTELFDGDARDGTMRPDFAPPTLDANITKDVSGDDGSGVVPGLLADGTNRRVKWQGESSSDDSSSSGIFRLWGSRIECNRRLARDEKGSVCLYPLQKLHRVHETPHFRGASRSTVPAGEGDAGDMLQRREKPGHP